MRERLIALAQSHPILNTVARIFLESRGTYLTLGMGEVLYCCGAPANSLFFILGGVLQIEYPEPGKQRGRAVALVTAPGVLGEAQTLYGRPWSGTGIALTELSVYILDRNEMCELIHTFPNATRILYCELAWQFLQAIERRRMDPHHDPERKIKTYVFSVWAVCVSHNTEDNDWLPITQSELARATGLSRETVTRLLAHWKRKNCVEIRRGRFRLTKKLLNERMANSIVAEFHEVNLAVAKES